MKKAINKEAEKETRRQKMLHMQRNNEKTVPH